MELFLSFALFAIETRYCSINSHNRYCIYNVIEIK